MASKLSGTSSTTFNYVWSNFGQLAIASVLPLVLLLASSVSYFLLGLDPSLGLEGDGEPAMSAGSLLVALLWGVLGMFVYCWLIAKICRLYLTGEPASMIGSGGTLRAGFWIALYYIAIALITFIPFIVVVVAMGAMFAGIGLAGSDPEAINPGAVIVLFVVGLVAFLALGWAQCRFVVGFPPLALGERAGLFDGWRLSKGNSLGLFGRVAAASLLWMVVAMVLMMLLVFAIFPLLGVSIADQSGDQLQALGYVILVQQILIVLLVVPFYWYLVVLFSEAYRRLSAA